MNDIDNIWKRILEHCSLNETKHIFTTVRGLEFCIEYIDENTVRPYRIGAEPILFIIRRSTILNDLNLGRPLNNERPSVYNTPAPSYRYALLNDYRIFYRS